MQRQLNTLPIRFTTRHWDTLKSALRHETQIQPHPRRRSVCSLLDLSIMPALKGQLSNTLISQGMGQLWSFRNFLRHTGP